MSEPAEFGYANRTGRPPGRLITLAGRVLPGIRKVQAQIEPCAAYWEEHNREALRRSGPPRPCPGGGW